MIDDQAEVSHEGEDDDNEDALNEGEEGDEIGGEGQPDVQDEQGGGEEVGRGEGGDDLIEQERLLAGPSFNIERTSPLQTRPVKKKTGGRGGKKQSWVWKFMEPEGKGRNAAAICKVCKGQGVMTKVPRHDASTRDMIDHLRRHNISQLNQEVPVQVGGQMTTYTRNSAEQRVFNWKLTRWVMVNKRALLLVQDKQFRDLIAYCDPRLSVPSRQTIRNVGEVMYKSTVASVKARLSKLWEYQPSYTADMWSAAEGSQYVAVQLHVIDPDFNYIHFSTGAVELEPPHDAGRVAGAIDTLLAQFGKDKDGYKISATTDSGSNIRKACEELLDHDWIPCCLHILHNVLGDVQKEGEFKELVLAVRQICAMFRTSPARWQELKAIQLQMLQDQIQGNDALSIQEEDEEDIDDEGEDIAEEMGTGVKLKILRPRLDQATRWGSVYNMLQRIIVLRISIETWYAKHGRDATAVKLTDAQWHAVQDLVDMLGIFKDFTLTMQARDVEGIVLVLPQWLRMLSSMLMRPAKYASRFSGRSIEEYQVRCNKPGEKDLEKLITPLQQRVSRIILTGSVGCQSQGKVGRINNFAVVFAWAICACMDPENVARWEDRVGKPLQKLVELGYLDKCMAELCTTYTIDIGETQQGGGEVVQGGGGGGALTVIREDQQLETDDEPEEGGIGAIGGVGDIDPYAGEGSSAVGKRKRQPNRRYVSSPGKGKARKRTKVRAPRLQMQTEVNTMSLGDQLLALAKDEIKRMAEDQYKTVSAKVNEGGERESMSLQRRMQVEPSPTGKAKQKQVCLYSDDDDDQSDLGDVLRPQQVEKEVVAYFLDRNKGGLPLPLWWKQRAVDYPLLAQVARRNMGVRASSAEAERDFSAAGLVVSKLRTKLTAQHVKYLTFCALNQDYIPDAPPPVTPKSTASKRSSKARTGL